MTTGTVVMVTTGDGLILSQVVTTEVTTGDGLILSHNKVPKLYVPLDVSPLTQCQLFCLTALSAAIRHLITTVLVR